MISKEDASYVEIIHTSRILGFKKPVGHGDFYVNGGENMPNCFLNFVCSHLMAGQYFAASMIYPEKFAGNQCYSMDDVDSDCCNGVKALMGNNNMSKT